MDRSRVRFLTRDIDPLGVICGLKHIARYKGKGSSSTTVQSYTPTANEDALTGESLKYARAVSPNALYLNDTAYKILANSIGANQYDFNSANNRAQGQITTAQNGITNLTNGVLPSAYQTNMENSIKSGLQNSVGSMLSDLSNRGIVNSSVTNTGMAGIEDSAASAMADAYTNNISTLSGLYGQQIDAAGQNISTAAAAQEAAQQPALNLWNASLGLNSATTGALSAIAGKQGSTTSSTNSKTSSGALFGSLLSGAASAMLK